VSARAAQFRALYKELRIADQQTYYGNRTEEYKRAHSQAMTVRYVLLIAAAVAGLGGQLTAGTGRAGLGVVAALLAALAGALTAFEALIGFPQLAKLYNDAALNLAEAEIDWDAARSDGDLGAQVDRVERIFRVENGQWGQLVTEHAPKTTPNTEGRGR
jgi:SMODS and SLOG-associating 2TM effector domain 1